MLSELTASSRRLALVGLAKNTGKTETLAALLRELEAAGRRVGVTSVGRDGEDRDVIDARIEKPRIRLAGGSLVATTDGLLRASGLPHELLEETDIRTPLGRVLIARLRDAGVIEVAGPSAAADVRAVSDAMLAHGAEQVLIDGAVDRRAASSPQVSDGLVLATGAVLGRDIEEVVSQTRDAVELVRLPLVEEGTPAGQRLRALADAAGVASLLVDEDGGPLALPARFILTAEAERVAELLDGNPSARWLLVVGALPERFLHSLIHPLRHRRRDLTVIVADPTKVFMWERGPAWYSRQGVRLQALARIELEALTVNPVAPQSHRFDSARLRGLLRDAIADLPIFDVLDADYAGTRRGSPEPARVGMSESG
ncbi:MAG: hypothetical protein ACLP1Q_15985 [Solirubrobacteraceae bacterium]